MNANTINTKDINAVTKNKFILKKAKQELDQTGNFALIGTTVTDLEGKYGYALEETGEYKLEILASGYHKLETGIFYSSDKEITKDFLLKKEGFKISLFDKLRLYSKRELATIFNLILFSLFFAGLLYSIIVTYYIPTNLNILFSISYILIIILNIYSIISTQLKKIGKVIDTRGNPLPGIAIRIYNEKKQLGVYLTNKQGEFKVNLTPGNYFIRCSTNLSEYNIKSYLQEITIKKNGYPKEDVVLEI